MESARRLLEGLRVRGVDGSYHPAYITFERDLPAPPYVRTPEHAEAERQFGLGRVEYRLVWALEG